MHRGEKPEPTAAVVLRSVAFHGAFSLTVLSFCIFLPFLFLPRRWGRHILKAFCRTVLWELEWICGLGFEIAGREHVPRSGEIVASKHQSAWETIALTAILDDPAFVLKRELFFIPVAGWVMWKNGHIGVRRGGGLKAITDMCERALVRHGQGRAVVIFPEGTRSEPNDHKPYRPGVAHLYRKLNVACIPVALNSGLYWPRRSILRYPGTITVRFLPEVPPGLGAAEFMDRLRESMEPASQALASPGRVQV